MNTENSSRSETTPHTSDRAAASTALFLRATEAIERRERLLAAVLITTYSIETGDHERALLDLAAAGATSIAAVITEHTDRTCVCGRPDCEGLWVLDSLHGDVDQAPPVFVIAMRAVVAALNNEPDRLGDLLVAYAHEHGLGGLSQLVPVLVRMHCDVRAEVRS
ncbi:hypothetical protein SAMN02982929_05330 [Saccharopolyspora kobensis]|uniref:Uncharacterized protein n=1 Tax=Saccharopolyspora kobensis TaxID=146035 RepID=A0A1H6E124_9PSEU|nr:hypothetical protein [Saccharopolyspora kobensis]SEG90874.1 hypothetical protein SAMN02982929_05330 [Saccharopolyspora kobensis]SFD94371.1 hypothetical protein SAMN05216506_107306 [Saccharopolyspora kobensis]